MYIQMGHFGIMQLQKKTGALYCITREYIQLSMCRLYFVAYQVQEQVYLEDLVLVIQMIFILVLAALLLVQKEKEDYVMKCGIFLIRLRMHTLKRQQKQITG